MIRTLGNLRTACAFAAAGLAIGAATSPARAYIEGNPLTVTALTSGHTATWVLPIDAGTWEGPNWHYDSGGYRYEMWDGGTLVGTLSGLHMDIYDDPQVVLNFTAQANAADTKFIFTSALVSFAALTNPTGQASAGVTVTDNNFNGALLSGQESNGAAYWANYNGLVPGGTNYASFFSSVSATALEGTHTDNANQGPTPIAGSVSDMSAQFSFMLSAFDAASGTSNYQIVPAPGALALLGLGGLAAMRRRR
jgi:MYXO-CTERM domain-containing protein